MQYFRKQMFQPTVKVKYVALIAISKIYIYPLAYLFFHLYFKFLKSK